MGWIREEGGGWPGWVRDYEVHVLLYSIFEMFWQICMVDVNFIFWLYILYIFVVHIYLIFITFNGCICMAYNYCQSFWPTLSQEFYFVYLSPLPLGNKFCGTLYQQLSL